MIIRGLIEGRISAVSLYARLQFPRMIIRGLIEGRSMWLSFYRETPFPRMIIRGLIEGGFKQFLPVIIQVVSADDHPRPN